MYFGALSYAAEIGSADRNEQEERQNDERLARNHCCSRSRTMGSGCRRV